MNLAEYSMCDGVALANLFRKDKISPKELSHLFADAVEKVIFFHNRPFYNKLLLRRMVRLQK